MLRVVIITIILTPYASLIWAFLSAFGFISFLILTLGYCINILWGESLSRIPVPVPGSRAHRLQSLNLSLDSRRGGSGSAIPNIQIEGASLRKQYDFLTRNGIAADALQRVQNNSFSSMPTSLNSSFVTNETSRKGNNTIVSSTINITAPSLLHQQVSSLLMEAFKGNLKPDSNLTKLISLYLKGQSGNQSESTFNEETVNDHIVDPLASMLVSYFRLFSSREQYDLMCLNAISVFEEQVLLYKEMRSHCEGKGDSLPKSDSDLRHIDDYNDFSSESQDASLQWSLEVDSINEKVVQRMKLNGKLHAAVGKSTGVETEYLRNTFNKLIEFLTLKHPLQLPTKLKAVQIIIREIVICQIIQPLVGKLSKPEIINSYILEKANRKVVVQKAVNSFRGSLENHYCHFPPVFLISHFEPKRFSLAEKTKYIDLVGRYSKKATSLIDMGAVRHEILREIRAKSDCLLSVEPIESDEDPDSVKRYIRALQILLKKLEKRIKFVETSTGGVEKEQELKTPYLTVRDILQDWYKMKDESGAMASLSLFYFLDYLEQKSQKSDDYDKFLTLLRFSTSAENYRKLVWRVNTGILGESSGQINGLVGSNDDFGDFSRDSHIRFQKEVQKIYFKFLGGKNNKLEFLSSDVMDSFKRYIGALEKGTPFKSGDYLCVMKAQKHVLIQLDDIFSDYLMSDSYLKWVKELQRLRVLRGESFNRKVGPARNTLNYFHDSALMTLMESELNESCQKLTGFSKSKEDNMFDDDAEPDSQTISTIITLEDVYLDASTSISGTSPYVQVSASSPAAAEIRKEKDDDDDDDHLPGELFSNSSKLSQVEENLTRTLNEYARTNMLCWKLESSPILSESLQLMQKHVLELTKEQISLEIGELAKQKAKYESQEQREALTPGQCNITIQEAHQDSTSGKPIVHFLVLIEQKQLNTGWMVKRRYNDFDALHKRLREHFPVVDDFDFPGKSQLWNRGKPDKTFNRMKALEKYLQRLIDNKDISTSEYVKNFLSSTYKPISESGIFHSPFDFDGQHVGLQKTQAKVLETLSKLGAKKNKMMSFLEQRRHSHSEEEVNLGKDGGADFYYGEIDALSDEDDDQIGSDDANLDFEETSNPAIHASGPLISSFVRLILALFDFKNRNSNAWNQENSALILLDQFLSSKGFPEASLSIWNKQLISDENVARFLKRYKDTLLNPNFESTVPQVTSLRIDTKIQCLSAFGKLGIENGNVLYLVEMLQNDHLNKHFLYTQLDSYLQLVKNC